MMPVLLLVQQTHTKAALGIALKTAAVGKAVWPQVEPATAAPQRQVAGISLSLLAVLCESAFYRERF